MTQSTERRILTFPAVHPCQATTPPTLLRSLIELCRAAAAHRPERFPIHRRSAREAVRQSAILLAFFEDVRDRGAALPDSTLLGFSDLHVTLQRLNHLLHDLSRRDARVWILAMSDLVTYEFRNLVRSVATALDVIPPAVLDGATPEVNELIRLLSKQAWRLTIDTAPADDRAAKDVRAILSQFKDGVAPAQSDVHRILRHLQIRSWNDCNDEILFLEEEFFGRDSDSDATMLLSGLIAFMSYCRATVFDVADVKQCDRKASAPPRPALARLNSEDLRCPISLELMKDPVTISTGHTYDRASIERWFKAGYLTCPVTGEKLSNTDIVPNSALRKLVAEFCVQNNIPVAEPSNRKRDRSKTLSPSTSAVGATRLLATFLVDMLSTGTTEAKNKAAFEIRLLSKSSLSNRACLVEANSVPWLLHLLYSADPSTQENAIAALLNLSKHSAGRRAIHEAGGLALILEVIKEGLKVEAQQNAAAVMFYLSSVDEYRQEIGEIPEAIPTLVELLKKGTHRGKKNAIVTLFGLLQFPGNHSKVLAADVIPVIVDLLSTERDDLVNDCVAVLAKLADRSEGTIEILSSCAVPRLVEVLRSSSSRSGREYCVSVLLALCVNGGEKAVKLLEKIPLLMPSLYSLVTDGSPQAGKKARSLLNHIHRLHDQECSAVLTSSVHDNIVRAQ